MDSIIMESMEVEAEIESPLDFDKVVDNTEPDYNKFNKSLNNHICTYKFSDEQLKKICIASKCEVHIPTANILFRIEQHIRETKGEPDKNKICKRKQMHILNKTMRKYNRKRDFFNQRQEKREIMTRQWKKATWVLNRLSYFKILNLSIIDTESDSEDENEPEEVYANESEEAYENVSENESENESEFHFVLNYLND